MNYEIYIKESPDGQGTIENGGVPAPLSWSEFFQQWEEACHEAWEDGHQEPEVTLPLNVFPGGAALANPITGRLVPVTRISPFTWVKS